MITSPAPAQQTPLIKYTHNIPVMTHDSSADRLTLFGATRVSQGYTVYSIKNDLRNAQLYDSS